MQRFRAIGAKLSQFLLSEQLSLKVIFDNITNTIISATVISGGVWVASFRKPPFDQIAADPTLQETRILLGRLLLWIGFTLMALNLAQVYLIHRRAGELFPYRLIAPTNESSSGWLASLTVRFAVMLLRGVVLFILLALQLATISIAMLFIFRTVGEVL